ncbi:trifunctional dihydropteroate synthetase [Entophlyctis luteolus]|nr:trifunctional dihydropteroate synthetase [Entophlyctis luteolus]
MAVQNLRVDCLVGVDAWERQKQQPLVISIVVFCDVAGSVAAVGDKLSSSHTISYSMVQTVIRDYVRVQSFRTLEALAIGIAHEVFLKCGLRQLNQEAGLSVKVEKPKALLFADFVGIEVTRTRAELEEIDRLLSESNKDMRRRLSLSQPVEAYDHIAGQDSIFIRQLSLRIPHVFNFRTMVKTVSDYVESTNFKTLEALIENVAAILIKECKAPKVWVRLLKPSAVMFSDTCGLEITRERDFEQIKKKTKTEKDFAENIWNIVYLGLGSNLGDRAKNISFGLDSLCADASVSRLLDTSFLYETKPMYLEDQPNFLNAACKITTTLSPTGLLTKLKQIEDLAGRDFSAVRNGPRPLDIDILFFNNAEIKTEALEIPHKLLHEREFVLRPLCDISPNFAHPTRFRTVSQLLNLIINTEGYDSGLNQMYQVTPFGKQIWAWETRTRIMGILNVTPDSFSDGGKYTGVLAAVKQTEKMISEGADIIDIGGQSTRPGADTVDESVEISRVIPVVEEIRRRFESVLVSVDTFRASVAKAAIDAGADFINDVTGGEFDPEMIKIMSQLKVPVCIMHMRGDPKSMQSLTTYENNDVVTEVRHVLANRVKKLIDQGVYRWNIIIDPGIGFAKTAEQNFTLLRDLNKLTESESPLARFPVLVGPSRKGFLKAGSANTSDPKERVWATAAACTASVKGGAAIVRVHDVREMRDVVATSDVMYRVRTRKAAE